MAYDAARERIITLLEGQLAEEKAKIAELQEILQQTQESLKQAKLNIAYFEGLIQSVANAETVAIGDNTQTSEPSFGNTSNQSRNQQDENKSTTNGSMHENVFVLTPASEDISLNEEDEDEDVEEQFNKGVAQDNPNPVDFLRPQFKGRAMPEVVRLVLGAYGRPMRAVEVARAAYDAPSSEAFSRARNSIGAELRIGAGKKGWIKAGRGRYVLDGIDLKPEWALTNNGKVLDS